MCRLQRHRLSEEARGKPRQAIAGFHQGREGGVVFEALQILGDAIDGFVDQAASFFVALAIGGRRRITWAVEDKAISDRPRVLRVKSEFNSPDEVLVSVEDTGAGIAAKAADRLFGRQVLECGIERSGRLGKRYP